MAVGDHLRAEPLHAGVPELGAVPVLWDAWSTTGHLHNQLYGYDTTAVARFNHIPGGCNVLYMDGHVGFVRYQGGMPIESPPNDHSNLSSQMAAWSNLMGGVG